MILSITLIFLVYLIKNLFLVYYYWCEGKFIYYTQEEISRNLFSSILKKDYSFHQKNNSSKFINKLKTETGYFSNALNSTMILISELCIVFGLGLFLLFYNAKIFTIIIVVFTILTLLYHFFVSKILKSLSRKRSDGETNRIKYLQEGFGGIKDIKTFGKENYYLTKYSKLSQSLSSLYHKVHVIQRIPKNYFETAAVLILISLIYFLSKNQNNLYILPTLGIYAAAAFKLLPSANKLLNTLNTFKFTENSVDAIYEEISNKKDIKESQKKYSNDNIHIVFKNVNFKYNNEDRENIIENLNIRIDTKKNFLITGETGEGKSTFLDLITGLQEPSKGEILINDDKLELNSHDWFKKIGYVSQNTFLFDDTILQNVTLQDSEEQDLTWFQKVLEISELKNFVNKLPQNSQTSIGEKGYNLSGGQRQRIGIARAIYKKPKILIFDESTNSLDKETEEKVLNNILEKLPEQSLIMISHKAILKKYFDQRINFDKKNITITQNN
jgi:ABC-type bacteriocin/lantibiotic exporter with double-glycine peptidase domain